MKHESFCIELLCVMSLILFGCSGEKPNAHLLRSEPADGEATVITDALSPRVTLQLFFDAEPLLVSVNGVPARLVENTATWVGWSRATYDPDEKKIRLAVAWTNLDGTDGDGATIHLQVRFTDNEPPRVIGGNVKDGQRDVDPELLNSDGVIIEFNEPIAKAHLSLAPENGHDLGWLLGRQKNKVEFAPLKAAPWLIKYNSTYVIQGFVEDAAGNQSEVLIRFTTENAPLEKMKITVIPSGGSLVAENAKIKTIFDNPVKAVVGATGEGSTWFIPVTAVLNVTWMNFDDSLGGTVTFTYELGLPDFEAPKLISSPVADGDRDVDPKLGDKSIRIWFNEDILIAKIRIVDENGIDIGWRSSVLHQHPFLGKKVVHLDGRGGGVETANNLDFGQIYWIVGEVEDWSGNKIQIEITFTTRDEP